MHCGFEPLISVIRNAQVTMVSTIELISELIDKRLVDVFAVAVSLDLCNCFLEGYDIHIKLVDRLMITHHQVNSMCLVAHPFCLLSFLELGSYSFLCFPARQMLLLLVEFIF